MDGVVCWQLRINTFLFVLDRILVLRDYKPHSQSQLFCARHFYNCCSTWQPLHTIQTYFHFITSRSIHLSPSPLFLFFSVVTAQCSAIIVRNTFMPHISNVWKRRRSKRNNPIKCCMNIQEIVCACR